MAMASSNYKTNLLTETIIPSESMSNIPTALANVNFFTTGNGSGAVVRCVNALIEKLEKCLPMVLWNAIN
uniref:Uncharacterized protein n=1 Tax=Panagrellus redivivus TaxID=6233 RepID=A0A7E4UUE9_PANRE